MTTNGTISGQEIVKFPQITTRFKVIILVLLLISLYFALFNDSNIQQENQSSAIISNPKINDIYFLDFRLLSKKLRPTEKYRLAKVVDITGNIVTLVYGGYFYQYQNAAVKSIQYGQLSYKDYFETKRYNIPLNEIKSMYHDQAIYLAKRPVRNKLFGNLVGPVPPKDTTHRLTYGKKENIKGEAFLKEQFSETNLKTAFDLFLYSSTLGYVKGQVNLSEMYLNGQHVKKDLNLALYWLKQASLQSYKPAILKYGIVCKQVESCNIANFYQELITDGVNIKVRMLDLKLGK